MEIRKVKKLNTNDIELDSVIETILETETIIQMLEKNYYRTSMEKADTSDVNINHLENIFSNETYYLAMKIVPLIERKVLYLSCIENLRLKLSKNEVIKLRTKGINHFKHNLELLYKTNKVKKGNN